MCWSNCFCLICFTVCEWWACTVENMIPVCTMCPLLVSYSETDWAWSDWTEISTRQVAIWKLWNSECTEHVHISILCPCFPLFSLHVNQVEIHKGDLKILYQLHSKHPDVRQNQSAVTFIKSDTGEQKRAEILRDQRWHPSCDAQPLHASPHHRGSLKAQ